MLGACAGWGAEFLGYLMLPAAVLFGLGAGGVMARLWKKKPRIFVAIAVPILMAAGAVLARAAVAQLLLIDSPELNPPLGAWQAVTGLTDPSPAPLIVLIATLVAAEVRVIRNGSAVSQLGTPNPELGTKFD